jgi:hypothetical protein
MKPPPNKFEGATRREIIDSRIGQVKIDMVTSNIGKSRELPYMRELTDKSLATKSLLTSEPRNIGRHVVILGSGASCAQADLGGEATGAKLPTMKDLIPVVGVDVMLDDHGIKWKGRNFEDVYSELFEENPTARILTDLEEKIREYFTKLELPNEPTLYDHLLLSLRPKDVIATFNWDPLLHDAWERNRYEAPLPDVLYLHGNVRVGYCDRDKMYGENGRCCSECQEHLKPIPLLYPIKKKNYADPFIKNEWKVIRMALSEAYTITFFGYGRPKTDQEAVALLNKGWKEKSRREWEHTEYIDTMGQEEIRRLWDDFIYSHYYLYTKDFYDSNIARHPRRSCEALYIPKTLGRWVENFPILRNSTFDELYNWLKPLIDAEISKQKKKMSGSQGS